MKSYAKAESTIPDLTQLTVAFWLRTTDTKPGTVISYAALDGGVVQDNAFTLQDYGALNLFINNQVSDPIHAQGTPLFGKFHEPKKTAKLLKQCLILCRKGLGLV